jgi:hypothetical protein
MRAFVLIASMIVTAATASTGPSPSAPGATILNVSSIQLLATPERFHGKRVRVSGWWTWAFEVSVLSPNREDAEYSMNGIWLDLDSKQARQFVAAQNGYCVIEGVFDASKGDGRSITTTSIRTVTRIERLRSSSERLARPKVQ